MATAIPGPEQAMRVYTRRDTYPEDDTIGGVGDLATYQVIGDDLIQLAGLDPLLRQYALQPGNDRFYDCLLPAEHLPGVHGSIGAR